eukprot:c13426_g1_i1 orf=466-888(+)
MTSLSHRTAPDQNSPNQNPSFLSSSFNFSRLPMDIVSYPSMRTPHSYSDSVMPDFDRHLPFGKYEQDLPPSLQASDASISIHLLDPEKLIMGPNSSFDNGNQPPGHNIEDSSCIGSLQSINVSSEDIVNFPGRNWGVGLD